MESEDPPATGSELFTLGSLDPSEHHENQDSSRLHVSVPRVSYRQMGSLSGGRGCQGEAVAEEGARAVSKRAGLGGVQAENPPPIPDLSLEALSLEWLWSASGQPLGPDLSPFQSLSSSIPSGVRPVVGGGARSVFSPFCSSLGAVRLHRTLLLNSEGVGEGPGWSIQRPQAGPVQSASLDASEPAPLWTGLTVGTYLQALTGHV